AKKGIWQKLKTIFLSRSSHITLASLHVFAVLAAQRKGEDVETSKKWAAGQNKQHSITKNTAKLDRETEELHHDRVPLEVGKVIQQGRQSKGLTQKDLATKINEKPQVIADYESGKAIPNNQVMGKIERAIADLLNCQYSFWQQQCVLTVSTKVGCFRLYADLLRPVDQKALSSVGRTLGNHLRRAPKGSENKASKSVCSD
uniref:Endothelial differentiation related factor 1 n=1 Tax=Sphenodon punctatus TaxID=8508 RepID=A0A8D0H2Y7_SPHPU